jgi:predicted nucleotidyltransferase
VGEVSIESERLAYVQKLDEAPRRIVELLSRIDGIQRVSLFGSYARGRRDLFTDLDVLVVWETTSRCSSERGFFTPSWTSPSMSS